MARFYINETDEELTYERIESFGGGMDAFTRSTLLAPDASQYLENIIIPDGFGARTRPGADRLGAQYTGKIQGAVYFDTPSYEQLFIGNADKLWYWNGNAWTEATGWTLTDAVVDFSAAQGVDKLLFTDGVQQLRTWNGTAWSAALGVADSDPPLGATILLWHAGRMWAAGFAGAQYKENDAIWGSALLQFSTGDWSKIDRNFRVGAGDGDPIVGLASLTSSADKGFAMAVLKQNSIWIVNTDPTATFTNFTANMGPENISDGIGCVGKRAFCVYGNDLLFVSHDKNIYSLARMQSAASQYEIGPPLSLPIQPYLDRVNWAYASTIAVTKYRELALFSVPLDASTVPNTVLVWNGRLQKWVGVWTGWTPNCWEVTRFSGVHRLIHGDNVGNVRQWKDNSDAADDATYLDDGTAIACKLWTRAMLFSEPLNDKDAFHCEARFSASSAVATLTLMADNVESRSWTVDVRPTPPTLPIVLPFTLSNPVNTPTRRGLRGLSPFNECYVKIESTAGWWEIRNVSLSAFVNTLASQ